MSVLGKKPYKTSFITEIYVSVLFSLFYSILFQMYNEWHISGPVVLLHLLYNQEKPQLAQGIGANSSGNYL